MLRMLIPAGYMIGADARGTPALVLCDGTAGPLAASKPAMHHNRHGPPHEPAQHREAPCPYAAIAAPVLPPLPPAFAPPPPAPAPAPVPAHIARESRAVAAQLPPATGPPLPA